MTIYKIICLCFFLVFSPSIWANCSIVTPSGDAASNHSDVLGKLLLAQNKCPIDVFEFRQLLKSSGLKLEPTLVANRGFHNPALGSFSLFEIVSGQLNSENMIIQRGDFFFGHFIAVNSDGYLTADQTPTKTKLMVEAIVWDANKNVYNFYELRGDGKKGIWHYQGNSTDIYADIQFLHRQLNPQKPQFGNNLRCSGCHQSGGPIMKELDSPQNDWWEPKRKLDFGGRVPDAKLKSIFETLVPAKILSQSVTQGVRKISEANSAKKPLSLQERLRPLFCPVEVNFMSDLKPNDENQPVTVPIEFFIDPRLSRFDQKILISRDHYEHALNSTQSYFPETNRKDADHAWLAPVKATSDILASRKLVKEGMIDTKFVYDVLSVDMTNPVFSEQRCRLLKLVPDSLSSDWQEKFKRNLSDSSDPAAKILLQAQLNSTRDAMFHQRRVNAYLAQCKRKLQNKEAVEKMYRLLIQRRAEIQKSEISANPLGQILEPGFRVIFPESKTQTASKKLSLTLKCEVE